ncbi:hypothetical protein BROC_01095 [Candidatus Brocadiaceae bacterium]|nr:hypothetical protein BROC_01095 [Candidatus Brocadiaceae bacterium]
MSSRQNFLTRSLSTITITYGITPWVFMMAPAAQLYIDGTLAATVSAEAIHYVTEGMGIAAGLISMASLTTSAPMPDPRPVLPRHPSMQMLVLMAGETGIGKLWLKPALHRLLW